MSFYTKRQSYQECMELQLSCSYDKGPEYASLGCQTLKMIKSFPIQLFGTHQSLSQNILLGKRYPLLNE